MHEPDDVSRVAAEIMRVAELPGMVSVFMRPNPAVDWRPFNDPVYDPIWRAASETGLPIALHPFLAPDLPGACVGLRLARPRNPDGSYAADFDPNRVVTTDEQLAHPGTTSEHAVHPGDREPGRRHELHRIPARRWRLRTLPRREVHLPRGQRRLVGPVAGATRPPLPEVPVGGRPICRCCRRSTCVASAGSASIRTRQCCAPRRSHSSSAPIESSGRATTRTPTPSFPG